MPKFKIEVSGTSIGRVNTKTWSAFVMIKGKPQDLIRVAVVIVSAGDWLHMNPLKCIVLIVLAT
jgi:hypothetical protein